MRVEGLVEGLWGSEFGVWGFSVSAFRVSVFKQVFRVLGVGALGVGLEGLVRVNGIVAYRV